MARKLPPLNALRAFEAAARHQSFTRAAEELGVAHSSISRHVRNLEDRLGVMLFRDLPRGLVLTQDGAAYLAEVSPAFDAIAEATEALLETPEGTVTVNAEPLFASKCLIPLLTGFRALHPEVDVRVEASRHLADVARYEADLAVRFVRPGGKYEGAILLSDAAVHPYAAPSLVPSVPLTARQMLEYPLLKDRGDPAWETWFALSGEVTPDEVPPLPWRMRSTLAVEAAIAGQAILLVSDEVVASEVSGGRLHRVSELGFRQGAFYLVVGKGAARRKPVRIFRHWLLEAMAPWRSVEGND